MNKENKTVHSLRTTAGRTSGRFKSPLVALSTPQPPQKQQPIQVSTTGVSDDSQLVASKSLPLTSNNPITDSSLSSVKKPKSRARNPVIKPILTAPLQQQQLVGTQQPSPQKSIEIQNQPEQQQQSQQHEQQDHNQQQQSASVWVTSPQQLQHDDSVADISSKSSAINDNDADDEESRLVIDESADSKNNVGVTKFDELAASKHPSTSGLNDSTTTATSSVQRRVFVKKANKQSKYTAAQIAILKHKCRFCEYRTEYTTNIIMHERTHTNERPHKCDECGKSFTQEQSLIRHQRIHTGEKCFVCAQCGNRFNDRGNLRTHERTHTNAKPYICGHCGKGFSVSSSLTSHTRVHTGEQPYECDLCGKRFTVGSHLRDHVKKIHKIANPPPVQVKKHLLVPAKKLPECYVIPSIVGKSQPSVRAKTSTVRRLDTKTNDSISDTDTSSSDDGSDSDDYLDGKSTDSEQRDRRHRRKRRRHQAPIARQPRVRMTKYERYRAECLQANAEFVKQIQLEDAISDVTDPMSMGFSGPIPDFELRMLRARGQRKSPAKSPTFHGPSTSSFTSIEPSRRSQRVHALQTSGCYVPPTYSEDKLFSTTSEEDDDKEEVVYGNPEDDSDNSLDMSALLDEPNEQQLASLLDLDEHQDEVQQQQQIQQQQQDPALTDPRFVAPSEPPAPHEIQKLPSVETLLPGCSAAYHARLGVPVPQHPGAFIYNPYNDNHDPYGQISGRDLLACQTVKWVQAVQADQTTTPPDINAVISEPPILAENFTQPQISFDASALASIDSDTVTETRALITDALELINEDQNRSGPTAEDVIKEGQPLIPQSKPVIAHPQPIYPAAYFTLNQPSGHLPPDLMGVDATLNTDYLLADRHLDDLTSGTYFMPPVPGGMGTMPIQHLALIIPPAPDSFTFSASSTSAFTPVVPSNNGTSTICSSDALDSKKKLDGRKTRATAKKSSYPKLPITEPEPDQERSVLRAQPVRTSTPLRAGSSIVESCDEKQNPLSPQSTVARSLHAEDLQPLVSDPSTPNREASPVTMESGDTVKENPLSEHSMVVVTLTAPHSPVNDKDLPALPADLSAHDREMSPVAMDIDDDTIINTDERQPIINDENIENVGVVSRNTRKKKNDNNNNNNNNNNSNSNNKKSSSRRLSTMN